ncbi:MAG: hypothetical protein IPP82_04315 [Xanthomonadales bacterium]|nr:hypothetical protein [Xanthomonadales bacterium]
MKLRNWLALLLALLMFAYAAINAAALQLTSLECWFVLSLMAASALALSLLTLRPATSIAVISALFTALQYAAVAKFEQLHDPLLVTDILYFSSFGIIDTLRQYPEIVWIGKHVVPAVLAAFVLLCCRYSSLEEPGLAPAPIPATVRVALLRCLSSCWVRLMAPLPA